jgi:hypothetical protein
LAALNPFRKGPLGGYSKNVVKEPRVKLKNTTAAPIAIAGKN